MHKDNNGQMGDQVWSADLFTDGSNAGSGPGVVVELTKTADPTGTFRGQWVRILALDDPLPEYPLQIAEVEVYGRAVVTAPALMVARAGNNLGLSWPPGVSGFILESADALPAAAWNAVTGVVSNTVTITIGNGAKFYRLKQ